jgi:hypothetical protein
MLALQVIIAPVTTIIKDESMNNRVYGEFDSLYDSFMGLTADRQRAVVEAAQSLLEAQREIELLTKNTGTKTPLPAGTGKKNSHKKAP